MTNYLDELLDYVELGPADCARLRALHPVLEPHFPEITDRFYAAIWRSPGAASVLSGPDQVERLRKTLIDWMSTGLRGPFDERFYERRSRIGRRHVEIGLAHQYMFSAMNQVRLAYVELIHRLCAPSDVAAVEAAIHKLLDIELAIMVRHYQLDSEERLIARERRNLADRMTAMQTMTAGIAHEVRNPLNAAKLQLELLVRRLRRSQLDEAPLVEPCELAQAEIERLTALLNDFLAFARPPELHTEDHDVVLLLRRVVELERLTAERRQVQLSLISDVPSLHAHVDSTKLHQIVLNLVRNAIEASRAGGHVTVELSAKDFELTIRVVDDGPGIPEQIQPRIFEPFFSTKPGGTGLGMSIVHSLVMLHGGTIEFTTSPAGTRFEITLPQRLEFARPAVLST